MTKNWCYVCEKEFELTSQSPKQCPTCKQDAFEEITAQSHPQLFRAYQPNVNVPNSTFSQGQQPLNVQAQLVQPLMGLSSIISGTYQTLSNNYNQNPQSFGTDNASIVQNSINQSFANLFANLPQIMGFTNQIADFFMQNLINSGQSYRPASQTEINALDKIEKVKQCAICQTDNDHQGFRLKCGHQFHSECLLPWFQRANTCPTCRDTI